MKSLFVDLNDLTTMSAFFHRARATRLVGAHFTQTQIRGQVRHETLFALDEANDAIKISLTAAFHLSRMSKVNRMRSAVRRTPSFPLITVHELAMVL
jgi:hypothetical protein